MNSYIKTKKAKISKNLKISEKNVWIKFNGSSCGSCGEEQPKIASKRWTREPGTNYKTNYKQTNNN